MYVMAVLYFLRWQNLFRNNSMYRPESAVGCSVRPPFKTSCFPPVSVRKAWLRNISQTLTSELQLLGCYFITPAFNAVTSETHEARERVNTIHQRCYELLPRGKIMSKKIIYSGLLKWITTSSI